MKTIKNIHLAHLHQEESYGYHQLALIELVKCVDVRFVNVLATYQECFQRFDEALKPTGASPITKQITDLDIKRDNAYRGLAGHIKNSERHYDADKAEAARSVNTVLQRYGDPTALPYIKENGVIENLVQDLKKADAAAWLAKIDGNGWVDELSRLNTEFIQFFSDRNAEQSGVITGLSKETRKQTDEAYKNCVRRINSLVDIEGDAVYAPIIDKINKLVDYERSVLSARTARHKAAALEKKEMN